MKLPDSFLEELRARTPIAALISRRVKLTRSGRQSKGCCPFHNEKTPSFYVYEDGYHCFGCGAHGDAVSFVMQTQGASFMEAVQSLASEAGLELPKASPAAEAAERRRLDLHGVLDEAVAHYRRRLFAPEGAAALAYLRGRGLTHETIEKFGLGWSGEGRGALASALAASDITQAQLLEAGLLRTGEDGEIRGELFFNRIMFPIRDRRGRTISFGGRILGDGQPKYVNGPETPLFSKRRTLYALDLAREAARQGAPVVAVEGYMDVIALNQAGFGAVVAPLGTALTTEQLEELWRLSPAPVLCFDGDAAGARAAARAASAALPALAPDRTIRIATLPAGEDPDTLVRKNGAPAFKAILDTAQPLSEALFGLLREGSGVRDGDAKGASASPEQRAAFRARLEQAAASIGDKNLAREYRSALLDRFFASSRRNAAIAKPQRAARPVPDAAVSGAGRERALAAIVVLHPGLLHDVEEAWCSLSLPPPMDRLRHAIISYSEHAEELDSSALTAHLRNLGLSAELAMALDGAPSCARPDALPLEAEAGWWHFYGLMHRGGLEDAVREAQISFERTLDAPSLDRLNKLTVAWERLRRGEHGSSEGAGSEWGEPDPDTASH